MRMAPAMNKSVAMREATENGRRSQTARRATNISLPHELIAEARELGINISKACEAGLATAVAAARRRRWLEENREALVSSNAFVEREGLPLVKFRQL
jgi:antitoxin CcdA